MSEHAARILWERGNGDFLAGKYSREHSWHFDGGAVVAASASPANVALPFSNPAHVDPEEAYVAAISSCHMLWFLYLASKAGFVAERYQDECVGKMTADAGKTPWVGEVVLRPRVVWSGTKQPTEAEVNALHHKAHELCFIANSVKSVIRIEHSGA